MLNRQQARDVDRRAIEDYGMSGLVLMENAARGCVDYLLQQGVSGSVAICCGGGNNGGDGFAMARRLELLGHAVEVFLFASEDRLQGDAAANYAILQRAQTPLFHAADWSEETLGNRLRNAQWIVDALLGTGAKGAPRPPYDRVLETLNAVDANKLAIDLPSGMDCDSGKVASVAFRGDHTCTFVDRKLGFAAETAPQFTGRVCVVDIGIPKKLMEEVLAEAS